MRFARVEYTFFFVFIGALLGAAIAGVLNYYSGQSISGFASSTLDMDQGNSTRTSLFIQIVGALIGGLILGIPASIIQSTKNLQVQSRYPLPA